MGPRGISCTLTRPLTRRLGGEAARRLGGEAARRLCGDDRRVRASRAAVIGRTSRGRAVPRRRGLGGEGVVKGETAIAEGFSTGLGKVK